MGSSSDNVVGITTAPIVVGVGASLTQLVDCSPLQNSVTVKAGGTMLIFGFQGASGGMGVTGIVGASIVAGYSLGYMMSSGEALNIDGPCRFYLGGIGATATAFLIKGLTYPGFTGDNGQ